VSAAATLLDRGWDLEKLGRRPVGVELLFVWASGNDTRGQAEEALLAQFNLEMGWFITLGFQRVPDPDFFTSMRSFTSSPVYNL
jgi:hypothetical protein